jgi:hypothetical protein
MASANDTNKISNVLPLPSILKIHHRLKYLFVYRGQKVLSLRFLAEAQPRLKTGEDKRYFLAAVHIKFLDDCTNYKAKDIIGKNTNLFFLYLLFSSR